MPLIKGYELGEGMAKEKEKTPLSFSEECTNFFIIAKSEQAGLGVPPLSKLHFCHLQ